MGDSEHEQHLRTLLGTPSGPAPFVMSKSFMEFSISTALRDTLEMREDL